MFLREIYKLYYEKGYIAQLAERHIYVEVVGSSPTVANADTFSFIFKKRKENEK